MLNLHPLFIHFPIALLLASFAFDLFGTLLKKETLRHAGWWTLLAGILGIVAAVGTGLWAESTAPHGGNVHELMETHKTLGLVALGIWGVLFVWRAFLKGKLPEKKGLLSAYFVVVAIALAIMSYGAHLGGRMVYEFGIGGTAVKQPASEHQHNHGGHEHGEHKH